MVGFLRSSPYAPQPKVQARFREFLLDRRNLQFGRPVPTCSGCWRSTTTASLWPLASTIDIFGQLAGWCWLAPPALPEAVLRRTSSTPSRSRCSASGPRTAARRPPCGNPKRRKTFRRPSPRCSCGASTGRSSPSPSSSPASDDQGRADDGRRARAPALHIPGPARRQL